MKGESMSEGIGMFICYSRADTDWKNRLQTHLTPIIRGDSVDFFVDERIEIGEKWEEKIQEKLRNARAVSYTHLTLPTTPYV